MLVVDNGSIFTEEIIKTLLKNNTQHTSIPFHQLLETDLNKFDSFILSGRRKMNKK